MTVRRKNFASRGCLTYDHGVRRERYRPSAGFLLSFLVIVSLVGRLHIIWNGEPRFMLVDDQGLAIRLVIEEALTQPFGGPRALDQKRVRIMGERVAGAFAEVVRVVSIEREGEHR